MDAQTAESFLNLAEQAGLELRGLNAKALFGQIEQQYGGLLAALQWFIDQGRADECFRLVSALALFWTATKRLDEGAAWCDRALALAGGDDARRGQALFDAGLMAFWLGDDDRAAALHNHAFSIGCQIGHPTIIALALGGLARIALRMDIEGARRLCREALAVTEGTDDRLGRSGAIHVLGVAAQMAGDFLQARALISKRMTLVREMGNYLAVSAEAGNLSMVERQLGNLDRAEALAREALEIDYQRGDEWAMPYKVSGLAAVATERCEFERAATLVGAAEAMMEAEGAAWPPDERPHYERLLATLPRAMGSAAFERARALGHLMTTSKAVDFALGTRTEFQTAALNIKQG